MNFKSGEIGIQWWGDIPNTGVMLDEIRAELSGVAAALHREDAEYDRLEHDAIENEADFDNAMPPGYDDGTQETGSMNSNRLPFLADEINDAHRKARTAARMSLKHAIQAGESLLEAKAAVGHGKWLDWLSVNVIVSERTVQDYMRLARNVLALAFPHEHLIAIQIQIPIRIWIRTETRLFDAERPRPIGCNTTECADAQVAGGAVRRIPRLLIRRRPRAALAGA